MKSITEFLDAFAVARVVRRVSVLRLMPGDVVIFRAPDRYISAEIADIVTKQLNGMFPDNKCLVLDKNADMSVFSPNEQSGG